MLLIDFYVCLCICLHRIFCVFILCMDMFFVPVFSMTVCPVCWQSIKYNLVNGLFFPLPSLSSAPSSSFVSVGHHGKEPGGVWAGPSCGVGSPSAPGPGQLGAAQRPRLQRPRSGADPGKPDPARGQAAARWVPTHTAHLSLFSTQSVSNLPPLSSNMGYVAMDYSI